MTHRLVHDIATWAPEYGLDVERAPSGNIAVFSPCRRLRYVLTRKLGDGSGVLVGCGLNPSTATADTNDRTVAKVGEHGKLWGCGLYVMLNAYAWRATNPADMKRAARRGQDVVGPWNDAAIRYVLERAGGGAITLGMWGANAEPARAGTIARIASEVGVTWSCLGTNNNGSPTHPLYLSYTTPREPWPRSAP